MLMMSPTASTSDSRNWTMVSPSVCAAGMCHSTTPSPLKQFSLKLAPSYPSLGSAARVHEHDAVLPDGRDDVAAAGRQQPDVALHGQDAHVVVYRRRAHSRRLLGARNGLRRERGHDNEKQHERSASQSHPNLNL